MKKSRTNFVDLLTLIITLPFSLCFNIIGAFIHGMVGGMFVAAIDLQGAIDNYTEAFSKALGYETKKPF